MTDKSDDTPSNSAIALALEIGKAVRSGALNLGEIKGIEAILGIFVQRNKAVDDALAREAEANTRLQKAIAELHLAWAAAKAANESLNAAQSELEGFKLMVEDAEMWGQLEILGGSETNPRQIKKSNAFTVAEVQDVLASAPFLLNTALAALALYIICYNSASAKPKSLDVTRKIKEFRPKIKDDPDFNITKAMDELRRMKIITKPDNATKHSHPHYTVNFELLEEHVKLIINRVRSYSPLNCEAAAAASGARY